MRRRFAGVASVVFLLVLCASVVVITLVAQGSNDRSSFKAAEQDAITSFNQQYEHALEHNEAWTAEPRNIALRYACGDECDKKSVDIGMPESGKAVVIVEDNNILDDSIKAIKQRIEIKRVGAGWIVEWAGWKQQCRRGGWTAIFQGRLGWHTQLCS